MARTQEQKSKDTFSTGILHPLVSIDLSLQDHFSLLIVDTRSTNICNYLKLSVTPKVHLVEAHAIGLCDKHNGFGGLGEDEGERAHQTGAKDEKRYGNMANYEKKARSMSQYGQMEKNLKVAAKKEELKDKTKRKFKNPRKSAEDRRAETNKATNEAREAFLHDGFPMLEGCRETLRDCKKARIEAAMF